MKDTHDSIATPPPAAQPDAAGTVAPTPQKSRMAEGFKNRTTGEAIFNIGAYAGVGYFGVTAVSVAMSWLLRDFKPAARLFDGAAKQVFHWTKGNKTGAALAEHAKKIDSNTTIAAMFLGGTIMSVLPIKALEDNKAKIVEGIDRTLYGNERVDSDAHILAAHAELAAAPKQTWLSVTLARVLAFAATFGTSLAMGSNDSPVAKRTGHSIDKHSIHSGRWLDGAVNHRDPAALKAIRRAAKASPDDLIRTGPAPDRITSRVFSYLTLDLFYTVITSGSLYVFTRVLAPFFERKGKPEPTPHAPAQAAATARMEESAPAAPAAGRTAPSPKVNGSALEGRLGAEGPAVALS